MMNEMNENVDTDRNSEIASDLMSKTGHVETDDYFNDDDFILDTDGPLSVDSIIEEEKDLLAIQQIDNVVICRVENFYKENGAVRNKISLKADPPVLIVESSEGEYASFLVTQEMSRALETLFGNVNKAYNGVPLEKKPFSQKNVKEWILNNKLKFIGLIVLAATFIIAAFF